MVNRALILYKIIDSLLIKYIIFFLFLIILICFFVTKWNRFILNPSQSELIILKNFYGNINISCEMDIIRLQNFTVDNIKHKYLDNGEVSIARIIEKRAGFCYDRSIILQKILISNNIKIRPIFFYYFDNPIRPSLLDLFNRKVYSHSVFEFEINRKWYVMKTNSKMNKFESLEEYMNVSKNVPPNTRFIRHLNNRNGRFIYPSWIPDFY